MTGRIILLCCVMLASCASAPPRIVMADRPPLDSALVEPCELPAPQPGDLDDYDRRDAYWMGAVLPALVRCAQRHAGVVEACMRPRGTQ